MFSRNKKRREIERALGVLEDAGRLRPRNPPARPRPSGRAAERPTYGSRSPPKPREATQVNDQSFGTAARSSGSGLGPTLARRRSRITWRRTSEMAMAATPAAMNTHPSAIPLATQASPGRRAPSRHKSTMDSGNVCWPSCRVSHATPKRRGSSRMRSTPDWPLLVSGDANKDRSVEAWTRDFDRFFRTASLRALFHGALHGGAGRHERIAALDQGQSSLRTRKASFTAARSS
jgi:hypothetical protein